jgi:hypothetical protein
MIGIEAVVVADAGRRAGTEHGMRIGCGCGARSTVPEAEAGIEPIPFAQVHLAGAEVVGDQPGTLRQEDEQEGAGDPLGHAHAR